MSKVGRNEPCPCGSGKKYKHCHWNAERGEISASGRAMRLHDLDRRLVGELMDFAAREVGTDWLDAVLDALDLDELDEDMAQLVLPCSVYEWLTMEQEETLLEIFLGSHSDALSERELAWVAAQRRSWLSAWEVLRVTPGVGISVRDLFTGEERSVLEQGASRMLSPRDGVLARVVDFEGISVFCGMHPRSLPPRLVAALVAAIRKTAGFRSKSVPVSRLRAGVPLDAWILTWGQCVEHHDASMARVPELRNTDGDPLLLTNDRFAFDPVRRNEIEAKLSELAIADEEAPSRDERAFTFERQGNAMNTSWDNTIVGRAVLGDGILLLETNSVRRADDLRAKVEQALASPLEHRARDHQDPRAMLEAGGDLRARAATKKPEAHAPEVSEALREFKRRHFEGWLDTPLPALSGLTPREAAAKPRKREQVVLLLKEIESLESRVPAHERVDVSSLWNALHLHGAGP